MTCDIYRTRSAYGVAVSVCRARAERAGTFYSQVAASHAPQPHRDIYRDHPYIVSPASAQGGGGEVLLAEAQAEQLPAACAAAIVEPQDPKAKQLSEQAIEKGPFDINRERLKAERLALEALMKHK